MLFKAGRIVTFFVDKSQDRNHRGCSKTFRKSRFSYIEPQLGSRLIRPVKQSAKALEILENCQRESKDIALKHEFEKTQVECRSGYKADEYPVAFVSQGARLEVAEIVDRWYEGGIDPEQPVIDYFRVRSKDGRNFLLKYSAHLDQWFIR